MASKISTHVCTGTQRHTYREKEEREEKEGEEEEKEGGESLKPTCEIVCACFVQYVIFWNIDQQTRRIRKNTDTYNMKW